ncbi:MAG: fasciclin domain-containing protein [Anaerolineae bacterium]|nr:fasciclin domain-containing protein [Anaerolineae bacterium]
MRKVIALLISIVMVLALAAPVMAQDSQDIVDVAVGNGSFTTLVAAVQQAELVDALKAEGPYTVFAPTDDAFAALLEATEMSAEDLLGAENLADILLYHVVAGEFNAESVIELVGDADYVLVDTLAGIPVKVSVDMGNVYINDAMVALPDVAASNGIIHVVDSVIMPPSQSIAEIVVEAASAEEGAEFTVLLAAVLQAELAEALSGEGPFTVFAPTDAAFAAALEALGITAEDLLASEDLAGILLYHVVSGEEALYSNDVAAALAEAGEEGIMVETMNGASFTVTADENGIYVDGAQIIMTDIMASNGVIHVIDAVILPPAE